MRNGPSDLQRDLRSKSNVAKVAWDEKYFLEVLSVSILEYKSF